MDELEFIKKIGQGVYKVFLWVQPGAKKNSIEGVYQGCLRVKVKSPPVENKANREIISFLSKKFGIKKSKIEIVSGQKNRKKIIIITLDKDLELTDFFSKYLD